MLGQLLIHCLSVPKFSACSAIGDWSLEAFPLDSEHNVRFVSRRLWWDIKVAQVPPALSMALCPRCMPGVGRSQVTSQVQRPPSCSPLDAGTARSQPLPDRSWIPPNFLCTSNSQSQLTCTPIQLLLFARELWTSSDSYNPANKIQRAATRPLQ